MQFDSLRAFPYPVLRPNVDDYLDGEMQATVDFKSSDNGRKLAAEAHFSLSVPDIKKLIKDKKAAYCTVIACRDTYYRKAYYSHEEEFNFEFSFGTLKGEVEIFNYVISLEKITSYQCSLINQEFGKGPFIFEEGSVLAVDEPQRIFIDQDVFKSLSSVFSLVIDNNLGKHEWDVKLSGDGVNIRLNSYLKEKIDIARNDTKNQAILMNSIYFSAVTYCLEELKNNPEEFSEDKWAQVLIKKCHNMGLDLDNDKSHHIAQQLMKHPMGLLDTYVFVGEE